MTTSKTTWRSSRALCVAVGLALALPLCGCISPGKPAKTATVTVSNTGRITFRGKSLRMAEVANALTNGGCTAATRITIVVPEGTSAHVIESMTRQLASAHYRRVQFLREKRPVVTIKPAATR